jgi:hypothetical protein
MPEKVITLCFDKLVSNCMKMELSNIFLQSSLILEYDFSIFCFFFLLLLESLAIAKKSCRNSTEHTALVLNDLKIAGR